MRASAASMETPAPARRSAAPDPKKPRLAQPAPRDPRSYAAASNGASQAAAAAELAMADELLAQYRTALGELTFNSKPIITNLTIIAGENLQAAKPIAGLICSNILEVPSDQKLPSLYLLDSIVKNIGKDYVKHFSARLPEVFCKAYKQVDPSIHHSMRHLFGTWKGVFPLAPLQMIEKELGFQSSANGSSGAASSRPDSQSQRPSNSIHGLLGSGGKAPLTTDAGDDIERANRISADRNAGRRLDALNARPSIQRTQRDPFSNPIHEKQAGRDARGLGFSNTPQQAAVGAGQVRSKAKVQDGIVGPYHTAGVGSSEQRLDRRSNLYANKDVRPAVRLDGALLPTPSISSDIISRASSNKNWKLSEEEEYVWDDVHSQAADYGSTNTVRKGEWMADEGNAKFTSLHRPKWTEVGAVEHLDSHKLDNLPRFGHAPVQDRRIPAYMDQEEYLQGKHEVESRTDREMRPDGQIFPPPRGSSLWMSQEKTIPDIGLDPRVSRFSNQPAGPYTGRSSQDVTSVSTRSTETFGQQKQRYWSSSPPPAHSPSSAAPFGRQRSPSPAESDFYPSRSFSQLGQNPQEEYRDQRALPQLAKDPHVLDQNALPTISPDLTSASNLLAGLLKSGFKPNNTSDLASLRAQPLVPAGPSPNTLTSSLAADPSLQSPAIENTTLQAQGPNISRPPLPPGLPPPPSVVSSTQLVDKAAPLSSLLSSLVKKGLISSPATDSSAAISSQQSKPSSMNTTDIIASASLPIIKPSVGKETSTPDSSAPKTVEIKMRDLIGLEFKPEKLRKYNEHVIGSLFDEQSHQCKTCGERFRLEEELRLHTTCRGSRESESIYAGIAPKRWYPNKSSYIDGSLEMENSTEVSAASDADLGSAEEVCEFMVPADESQIICALCGDPFDDIYSIERGDWMFKDAVFLDYPKGEDSCGNNVEGKKEHVPIVHARCMPRSSNDGMEED
ncbi:hypothetical protein EJB05_44101 [Eragrostis curvula]|uniref:CID domain-containing protein n=1 Tax=Eragrostis curvula TaxID=38414 RepID=A0A5J9TGQ3_9POAL|nr:hypothetical protein EJB05_44101 [Eragrostis curvula]